jgi:hypothetical protein
MSLISLAAMDSSLESTPTLHASDTGSVYHPRAAPDKDIAFLDA